VGRKSGRKRGREPQTRKTVSAFGGDANGGGRPGGIQGVISWNRVDKGGRKQPGVRERKGTGKSPRGEGCGGLPVRRQEEGGGAKRPGHEMERGTGGNKKSHFTMAAGRLERGGGNDNCQNMNCGPWRRGAPHT